MEILVGLAFTMDLWRLLAVRLTKRLAYARPVANSADSARRQHRQLVAVTVWKEEPDHHDSIEENPPPVKNEPPSTLPFFWTRPVEFATWLVPSGQRVSSSLHRHLQSSKTSIFQSLLHEGQGLGAALHTL